MHCFYKRPITPSKIVTQIELDLCFDIIYQHTKFKLNRCSLSKVIKRTPNFDNGRTDGRTGVTLNAPPPFFEWWGHNKLKISRLVRSGTSMQTFRVGLYTWRPEHLSTDTVRFLLHVMYSGCHGDPGNVWLPSDSPRQDGCLWVHGIHPGWPTGHWLDS